MIALYLQLILTESPALVQDVHNLYPALSILRDFALERIADGTWNPKAQIPAHSLLAWAEARALEVVDSLDLQPVLKARWSHWIRKGMLPNTGLPHEFDVPHGQVVRAWIVYLHTLNTTRTAHFFASRPAYLTDRGPEYPRPEGEILRELEAAEDAARWAHLMQLWTAHTGKTWSQS